MLAAGGVAGGMGAVLEGHPFANPDESDPSDSSPKARLGALLAVTEVVYPRRTKASLRRVNEIRRSILDKPDNTGAALHHMVTTRVETDHASSVVNLRLWTHNLQNLSVTSSSVFVTSGAMNPTLTIAALALKAANHVKERL